MQYKISQYLYVKNKKEITIIYNMLNNSLFAIDSNAFKIIQNNNWDYLKECKPNLFTCMIKLGVIIPFELDEYSYLKMMNKSIILDNTYYRLTIMPTLNCNFHCWYCYEEHKDSKMSNEVQTAIINHIKKKIDQKELIGLLDLDWFGGEPLLYFDEIVYPLSLNIKAILNENNILFNNIITTNGYLIDEDRVQKFIEIGMNNFQITLDGDKNTHDKIRFMKGKKGTFDQIINNINLLASSGEIDVMVRINYTEETLKNINNIVNLFSEDAKKRIIVGFQQVWQDSRKKFISPKRNEDFFRDNDIRINDVNLNKKFHVCYADRVNQAIINYDANVFKCTARDFINTKPDGVLLNNGDIDWDKSKVSKRFGNATFENTYCPNCKLLPVCMGICSQKMLELKDEKYFKTFCLELGIVAAIEDKIEKYYRNIIN